VEGKKMSLFFSPHKASKKVEKVSQEVPNAQA
jgi:hypothetical protein